jgi:hypothetical protein
MRPATSQIKNSNDGISSKVLVASAFAPELLIISLNNELANRRRKKAINGGENILPILVILLTFIYSLF